MFVCMPAASPAGLPETFLGADFRSTEPFQRLARPPLVEQLPRRGVALGGAAQGVRGGALVALGEQQLGARLRHRRRPGAAPPAPRAVLGALQELAGALELGRRARTPSPRPRGSRSGRTGRPSAGRTASRHARSAPAPRRPRRAPAAARRRRGRAGAGRVGEMCASSSASSSCARAPARSPRWSSASPRRMRASDSPPTAPTSRLSRAASTRCARAASRLSVNSSVSPSTVAANASPRRAPAWCAWARRRLAKPATRS